MASALQRVWRMTWLHALGGGMMIGAAGVLVLLSHGRVAGVSGIIGSLLRPREEVRDLEWRLAFMIGLAAAGVVAAFVAPAAIGASARSLPVILIAGLLVGIGTRLGSGCTSGHGVCGLGRLSMRSAVAVATFMATGVLAATVGGVS